MTLSKIPRDGRCRVAMVDVHDENDLKYLRNGLTPGSWLQVLCRHPAGRPHVIEVQLENLLTISVPINFARRIQVTPANEQVTA